MDEKQIDELARMLISYIKTGNGNTELASKLIDFWVIFNYNPIKRGCDNDKYGELAIYFVNALRREYTDPEAMQRRGVRPA